MPGEAIRDALEVPEDQGNSVQAIKFGYKWRKPETIAGKFIAECYELGWRLGQRKGRVKVYCGRSSLWKFGKERAARSQVPVRRWLVSAGLAKACA